MIKQPFCYGSDYNIVVMDNFGDWLKRHRKELGLHQREVARTAGVSTSYISTLERGQKHSITGADLVPDRAKVVEIAKAVKGSVDEALRLFGYTSANDDERFMLPDGVIVEFTRTSHLSDEQKDKIVALIKTLVAGVRAENESG